MLALATPPLPTATPARIVPLARYLRPVREYTLIRAIPEVDHDV